MFAAENQTDDKPAKDENKEEEEETVSTKKLLLFILLLVLLVSTAGCFGGKKKTEYCTLSINIDPPESGNVVRTPAGPSYKKGTVVTLLAEPADGWKFSGWKGDLTGNDNPATVTMDADKSVTAVFEEIEPPLKYVLTINIEGEGDVTQEIVASADGTEYEAGTRVMLTAKPADGWAFFHWGGDLTGNDNPAAVTMDADKSVTAVFVEPTGPCTVTGRITLGRMGPAVTGATITVLQSGTKLYSTATNEEGQYSLPIPAGGNVDLIAAKDGLAGSRFQEIHAPGDGIFTADIIMKEPDNLYWNTNPPSLTVTGVSPGDIIYDMQNISLEVAGEYALKKVLMGIGAQYPDYYTIESQPYGASFDTSAFPDGESFIHIVAYDLNNNCVITHIPVVIENDDTPGPPLLMNEKIHAIAVTEGDDMQYDSLKKLGCSIDRNFGHKNLLSRVQKDFSILAAEKNSACYVMLEWRNEFLGNPDFKGYNVYRSSSPNGPWRRLGNAYDDYNWYYILDTTPEVTPGEPSYYKVVPYSASGVEGSGQTQSVTPLGRFEVNLTTPVYNAKGVSLNPTLSWNHNGLEAEIYYYELYLLSLGAEPFQEAWTWVAGEAGLKSVGYNQEDWGGTDDSYLFPLQNNWRYQWDVIYAEAVTIYEIDYNEFEEEYDIISAAVSMGVKGNLFGSYNGAFVFTTGE